MNKAIFALEREGSSREQSSQQGAHNSLFFFFFSWIGTVYWIGSGRSQVQGVCCWGRLSALSGALSSLTETFSLFFTSTGSSWRTASWWSSLRGLANYVTSFFLLICSCVPSSRSRLEGEVSLLVYVFCISASAESWVQPATTDECEYFSPGWQ